MPKDQGTTYLDHAYNTKQTIKCTARTLSVNKMMLIPLIFFFVFNFVNLLCKFSAVPICDLRLVYIIVYLLLLEQNEE